MSSRLQAEPPEQQIRNGIQAAFLAAHQGWSADEVILRDDLNQEFLAACRQQPGLADCTAATLNWGLLTLRKSGTLEGRVTNREAVDHQKYQHAAEIAARWIEDRYGLNIDRALCNPDTRAEFDKTARDAAPGVDVYFLRKGALALRKKRQLQPELLGRVAEWDKTVLAYPLSKLKDDISLLPRQAGIYIFRDPSGYLYVGEAKSLRERIHEHLESSDRASLAEYLNRSDCDLEAVTIEVHVFGNHSPGREVRYRRAYESELIRSRQPRYNLRP